MRFKAEPKKGLWKEEGGNRSMDSFDSPGQITTPHGGHTVLAIVLNLLHLGVWFACLWLLLRFQWPHALLGAAILWLVMTFVVPTIFAKIPRKPALLRPPVR